MKNNPSKNRRRKGEGNGSIHWRTITKNGKDYPQAYYHWQENGKKRTKYIPKKLLGDIQEAEAAKRPVVEILHYRVTDFFSTIITEEIRTVTRNCRRGRPSKNLRLTFLVSVHRQKQ
ncbi:hypothetical protein [Nostoc flagelliforme]|uniref:hypothetical protein n=1 Tax=Nostoc flagelliforme TaxID=1306274 RepID=UPI001CEC2929|nr:hypothetical protein [Nostoc flagelliforme]